MEPTAGDSGQMIAAGEPLVLLRPRGGDGKQEGLACVTYFPVLVVLDREDTALGSPVWFRCSPPAIGVRVQLPARPASLSPCCSNTGNFIKINATL